MLEWISPCACRRGAEPPSGTDGTCCPDALQPATQFLAAQASSNSSFMYRQLANALCCVTGSWRHCARLCAQWSESGGRARRLSHSLVGLVRVVPPALHLGVPSALLPGWYALAFNWHRSLPDLVLACFYVMDTAHLRWLLLPVRPYFGGPVLERWDSMRPILMTLRDGFASPQRGLDA
ncbi:unnamed protein product [Symbiodinium sp. CCMP2592]|nr:unnamed protein product [Symbiodinium sp. CCMP2592]